MEKLVADDYDPEMLVWVISRRELTEAGLPLLSFRPESTGKLPRSQLFPAILCFTTEGKAEAYLKAFIRTLNKRLRQAFGNMQTRQRSLCDVVAMAALMPGNVAIDRTDEKTTHPLINVVRLVADMRSRRKAKT